MTASTTFVIDEKRYCPCGVLLPYDNRVKYCSQKCEIEARRKYMMKRMRELRAQRWTDEMSEKMKWLKDNQQFADDIILDKCWVCGSTKNLILHHVKYYPECIQKVLCRTCSQFLHKSLLRGRKCRPKIIR